MNGVTMMGVRVLVVLMAIPAVLSGCSNDIAYSMATSAADSFASDIGSALATLITELF
jgi:uncharacterized membrane protein